MLKRRHFLSMIFLLMIIVPIYAVNAVTYSSESCYYFNRSTGAYATYQVNSGYGKDCVKKLDGNLAYCSEWATHISSTNYKVDTVWNKRHKKAVILGLLINLINKDYSGTEGYALTAAAINTYNRREFGDSSAYDYYSVNSTVKKYYDMAVKAYTDYKLDKTVLPSIKFTVGDSVLNYSSANTYISEKVTLSGMVATYGGSSDTVTYTITPTSSVGSVQLCTKANGEASSCKNSVTLTNRSTNYDFYVKVTGVTTTDNDDISVSVTAKGANSTGYFTTVRYVSDSSSQKLIVPTKDQVNRSVSKTVQFSVPSLNNHTITVYKVDENGEKLTGATLKLYKDSATGTLLKSNTNGASKLSYTTPKVSTGDDDFYNHKYYLVEESAPDGYVLGSRVTEISVSNTNRSVCYHNGGADSSDSTVADNERCNFDNYVYKCVNQADATDVKDVTDAGNCNFEPPVVDSGTTTSGTTTSGTETTGGETTTGGTETTGGETTTGGTETTGGETSGGETPPAPPAPSYDLKCWKVSDNTIVDDTTFCTNKSDYTLIKSSNGNVTITHPNIKNKVIVSKKAITGDDEVPGAELKICDKASYDAKKTACDAATAIDGSTVLSWTSGVNAQNWFGLKHGTYYIVESVPPAGYVLVKTAVEFTIDELGNITTGGKIVESSDGKADTIVINNSLNSVTISKDDIATSKELPGATINICETYVDEKDKKVHVRVDQYTNECVITTLADGKPATWVSGDTPHQINGLPHGTYALVEKIAPSGYSTAETIIFTMNADGTLSDANGKSLKDTKIVMHDKKLSDVKTGMLGVYVVVSIIVLAGIFGTGSYFFLRKSELAK